MRWKTQSGEVLEISEMTDAHLINALKYEYKKVNERWNEVLSRLSEELKRRDNAKFFNQKTKCFYCSKMMRVTTFEPEREVGFSFPKYKYSCQCGASSNYIEKPPYKEVKFE